MPKFMISATGDQGKTVAEQEVEKVGRQQAMDEGIAELLLQPMFPPEVVQFYRAAIERNYDKADIWDTCAAKWGLQFFCREIPGPGKVIQDETRDGEEASRQPHKLEIPGSNPGRASQVPPPAHADRTPRQLLRDELVRLNKAIAQVRIQKRASDKLYNDLSNRREECLRLLKSVPLKVVKHGSKNRPPASA